MEFEKSLLNGMVKPFSAVDQMLQSQGFSRRGSIRFTYNMQIEDAASHTLYYLRIPARHTVNHNSDESLLKLDRPYIGKERGPDRYRPGRRIPLAVIEAAQHKIAEVASYLKHT